MIAGVDVGSTRRSRRLAAPRNRATVHLIVGDDRTLRDVNLGRLILRPQPASRADEIGCRPAPDTDVRADAGRRAPVIIWSLLA